MKGFKDFFKLEKVFGGAVSRTPKSLIRMHCFWDESKDAADSHFAQMNMIVGRVEQALANLSQYVALTAEEQEKTEKFHIVRSANFGNVLIPAFEECSQALTQAIAQWRSAPSPEGIFEIHQAHNAVHSVLFSSVESRYLNPFFDSNDSLLETGYWDWSAFVKMEKEQQLGRDGGAKRNMRNLEKFLHTAHANMPCVRQIVSYSSEMPGHAPLREGPGPTKQRDLGSLEDSLAAWERMPDLIGTKRALEKCLGFTKKYPYAGPSVGISADLDFNVQVRNWNAWASTTNETLRLEEATIPEIVQSPRRPTVSHCYP